ncbi:hypothetical protein BWR58_26360 [Shigella sonnei]|nr:hypothetical protein BWR58_26360 [Shigella sonnei]
MKKSASSAVIYGKRKISMLQSDMEKAGELAARDRAERESSQLKYTGEAQKAYERLLTPLENQLSGFAFKLCAKISFFHWSTCVVLR